MNRRVLGVIVVSLAVFILAAAFTAYRLTQWHRKGFAGVSAFVETSKQAPNKKKRNQLFQNGRVMVTMPHTPASDAGIESGDVIESVDGVPINERERLQELDARLKSGDRIVYRVRRGTNVKDVAVTLRSPVTQPWTIFALFISAIVAIAYVAIGLLVYTRKPDDMRAIVFHAMSLVGALSMIAMNAFAYDAANARGIAFGTSAPLMFAAMMMFALSAFPLTLHLALIFPKVRPIVQKRPWIIRWIYGLTIVAAVGLALLLVGVGVLENAPQTSKPGPGFKYALLALVVVVILVAVTVLSYPLFTCIALYRSYREANAEEKRQVRWPLWGTLIAVSTKILITAAGFAMGFSFAVSPQASRRMFAFMEVAGVIPRVASLLIPVSFAFAILKHRLMNIDVIIKKTVAYTILSGAVVFMYLVLVGGLGTVLVRMAGVQNQTMVIASTLVVALLFVPLRNRLQTLVDRNLFRQKVDYPQALRAIAAETLASTDVITFLGSSAETIQQALQNRAVVIFARRHDELVASAKVGVPDTVLGSLRIDMLSAEGVDRPLDPRRRPLAPGAAEPLRSIGAALVVPMRSHGALHGLVALAPKLSDQEFDLEDLEFASSASDQMAIAMDRIRLHVEEEDFEQARAMQQALLPADVPSIGGVEISGTWKPARAVGGDYYDLLRLSDTKVGICIGDVAGKGMPAALLMSGLQAAVRASAGENVTPKELCERVRRVVVPSLAGGRFVTFFYCTIDTAERQILYCNAGHNPPVLARAEGGTAHLDAGGSVLSRLFRNETFQQGELELRDGDRLVLFTDGVSESRDASGTDYGEDRLEQLIVANRAGSAADLLARIVDEVTTFSGGRTDDDLTLVTVAVTLPA